MCDSLELHPLQVNPNLDIFGFQVVFLDLGLSRKSEGPEDKKYEEQELLSLFRRRG